MVIEGGRAACAAAGIPLAGGHSIDSPEPIFGLAVTGILDTKNLKKNGGAQEGDYLYLSKGLGVGILSTAQKKKIRLPEHDHIASESMLQLNKLGAELGKHEYVHSMTDVTGFGLLGHLSEMCEASQLSAEVTFDQVPLLHKEALDYYFKKVKAKKSTAKELTQLTDEILTTKKLEDFQKILCTHEEIVSKTLKRATIKEERFSDYWGCVKSLGAWGGDFCLVSSTENEAKTKKYFSDKGYDVVIPFEDMIINE